MKRVGGLMEAIAERDNLRRAFALAQRGRRAGARGQWDGTELETWLADLRHDIVAGCVEVGRFHRFVVHDPKRRVIHAASFRERVLHHAIIAHAGPVMDRVAISDSFACRTGKGVHRARSRVQNFARRCDYFVKLDVRRYFDSVAHGVLSAQLHRLFKDPALLVLLGRIIDAYHVQVGRGVPIGSLTSQYFANSYLAPLDHFIKQHLRCRGYVRYMDDLLLLHDDPTVLANWQVAVRAYCEEHLRLELKPADGPRRCRDGVAFLGARVTPTAVYPNRRTRRRLRRKLEELESAYLESDIDVHTLELRAAALLGQVAHTRCTAWRRRAFRRSIDA